MFANRSSQTDNGGSGQNAKRDQPQEQTGALQPPSLSLPKGGGAVRGMGEKFAANPVTGTGSMTVPIATSPGRSGFGPQLALSYDSGAGNGPFGLGWNLSLPAITRKTDKGLPQYRDAEESDVFILSGAEDLVPVYREDPDGSWVTSHVGYHQNPNEFWVRDNKERLVIHEDERDGYLVRRYCPRIEGLFARIERWTSTTTGEIHWRSISKDNITTLYGKDNKSRIFDPAEVNLATPAATTPTRIFSWLICESYDDKGNAIVYDYVEENDDKVDLAQANERNRVRTANRYLKRIKYGNRVSRLVQPDLATAEWMFEVVFDYDEAHIEEVALDPDRPEAEQHRLVRASAAAGQPWSPRPDPFSSYRAGFEVRTYRLCQRVLMFHHIPNLPTGEAGYDGLVRSTDFTYGYEVEPQAAANPVYSKLLSVTQTGYKRNDDSYISKSLPPLEFTYSEAQLQTKVYSVDAASLENLPVGLDGAAYQWTDLHGEGIPGILTEQGGAWFYKRNLSPINSHGANGKSHLEAKFAPVELVALKPNLALGNGAQLMDLAGDGQPDLVVMDGPLPGFYEHDLAEGWNAFRPFTARLNRDTRDPNLKFVDLDGDGHADVLITEDQAFVWHPSLGEAGFGPAQRVQQTLDEEKGPRLVFADGEQAIYLADLSGDGLTDLVRIRNGEVCYWPNLGYGRFGAKVTMDNAPCFDMFDQFNQQRIRLADIDGSGTTDIIYLHGKGVRIYFNQSGNRWSAAQTIPFPAIDNLAAVQAVDLLADGTACLVWSSPLPGAVRRPMHYVKLMGEEKPHLLVKTVNNLGAETVVQYAPSTRFYLADKVAGKPWITRLPFPVHVVERVESYDRVSGNRFVTRYAYHHGYFDGEEREFRGFGMVEQWDTEEIGTVAPGQQSSAATNLDAASYVPPVLTRTWFHTGIYLDREHISRQFENDYYREPGLNDPAFKSLLLPDTLLPASLTLAEEREACRALKGAMLRQEVYALDGVGQTGAYPFGQPYTVAEQNFAIRHLQPQGDNRHAVFFTHPNEVLTYHYERNATDPRIQHALTLEVDKFGNVLKSAAIGYGRRQPDLSLSPADQARQVQILITYTENRVTKDHDTDNAAIDQDNDYRTPLPCESRTYELTGVIEWQADYPTALEKYFRPKGRARFTLDEIRDTGATAIPIDYEQDLTPRRIEKRLIEHVRTYYRRNNLSGSLPLGELQSLALPFESYKLAFTPGLVSEVYGLRATDAMLANEGRYVHTEDDTNWWIPSGRVFFSPIDDTAAQEMAYARQHFFLPHRYRDPFHTNTVSTESFVAYDTYDLLVHETMDVLGNRVTIGERAWVLPDGTQLPEKRRNDYRVLQPALVMDPNRNCSEVAFDALGMVVGSAVMGKPEENPRHGDQLNATFRADLTQDEIDQFLANPKGPMATTLLADATTRVVYDLTAYWREPDPAKKPPAVAATLARETHVRDLQADQQTKIQVSLSYSDGFGRVLQQKVQAEPGPVPQRHPDGTIVVVGDNGQPVMSDGEVSPRWVGSGWTLFNNKGKPVRQFEPFFSDTHKLDHDVRIGVSPWLFYDPVGRVVATLHPNHTWEKVVFDPWQQTTSDVNDTVTTIPSADDDVKGFFLNPDKTPRLPVGEYQPTWHELRTDPAYAAEFAVRYPNADDRAHETVAATKAVDHANTPTIAHFDALGRPFLTIADNGNGAAGLYETRVELDIEGNQRSVTDARGRIVMQYAYDMLGNRVHQASMEAGERWMLNDVSGKPIRAWDSRRFIRRMSYDQLRRPLGLFVSADGAPEFQAQKTEYGESKPGDPKVTNHLGRVWKVYDGAGSVTSEEYDFKGNLLSSTRRLLLDYKNQVNWLAAPAVNDEDYPSRTDYDALNRPRTVMTPDRSVYRPTFNEANLLDKVDVNLRATRDGNDQPLWTPFVKNIDYDAKGQRLLIAYGSGAAADRQGITTTYAYDPLTLRLHRLQTTRPAGLNGTISQLFVDPAIVQDLHYTYDPVGNITRIEDAALKTIQNGHLVAPVCAYTYDAIYRLIEAQGREHIGQTAHDFNPPKRRDFDFAGLANFAAHPNDLHAMRIYTETYVYDAVGNFDHVRHSANGGSWTRTYEYDAPSLIGPAQRSNRLTKTTVGNNAVGNHVEIYTYADSQGNDVQGCMTAINTMRMAWDFADQLAQVDLQGGGTAYYVYDTAGQRVRKVIENQLGTPVEERLYLGGFEVYRKLSGTDAGLVRETLHIMDDKQRIALVETRNEVDDGSAKQLIRYQLDNHLGSASVELDQNGGLISYEEYHPYGTTAFQAGRSAAEVSLKRYRYTGKERDEETGFGYHGARYYAPWLGRWTNCDPAGLVDGLNLYEYVRGNPISYNDPLGKQSKAPSQIPARPDSSAGRVLALGTDTREFPGYGRLPSVDQYLSEARKNVGKHAIKMSEIPGATHPIPGAKGPISGEDVPPTFDLVRGTEGLPEGFKGLPSSVVLQEALEGKHGITDIHISTVGVDIGGDFHTSAELRAIIANVASGQNTKVNIHIFEDGKLSTIPKGTSRVVGSPLPERIARFLPNLTPPISEGTSPVEPVTEAPNAPDSSRAPKPGSEGTSPVEPVTEAPNAPESSGVPKPGTGRLSRAAGAVEESAGLLVTVGTADTHEEAAKKLGEYLFIGRVIGPTLGGLGLMFAALWMYDEHQNELHPGRREMMNEFYSETMP